MSNISGHNVLIMTCLSLADAFSNAYGHTRFVYHSCRGCDALLTQAHWRGIEQSSELCKEDTSDSLYRDLSSIKDCELSRRSKYEPEASFWHGYAEYPGAIFEVAYSQKKKQLGRLAENYLLDSDANVQAVIGLDVEYGKKGSRKATFSVWRTRTFPENNGDGYELPVVHEATEEAFRDEDGNPTGHTDLRLRLHDFAHRRLVYNETESEDRELVVSAQQLREFLNAAEVKVQQRGSLSKDVLAPGVKKRKRSTTPPKEITSEDEAKYIEQEKRVAKRTARDDLDYENP